MASTDARHPSPAPQQATDGAAGRRALAGASSLLLVVALVLAPSSAWVARADPSRLWSIAGNSGTNPSTDFLGTTDSQPLVIRTNTVEALRVLPGSGTTGGNVGIGTPGPAFRLDVNGDVNGTTLREGGVALGARYLRLDGSNAPAGGVPISITGNAATATTAVSFSGSLAGDVQGGQTTTRVVALQGTPLGSTAPSSGQVLQFNGTQWAPASTAGVLAVGATAPLSSTGGQSPTISLTGVVPIANGGTGAATQTFVDLTTDQTVGGTKTFSQPINGSVTGSAAGDWHSTGNAGTTPGTSFLGTTDNQPLEVRVNNQRALRLEPNATSPNVIGGFSGNSVAAGVVGATIAGGGESGLANNVTASLGTVGGGASNTASGSNATVGGGFSNTASGGNATVGGGFDNNAAGANSFAAGSFANVQAAHHGTFLYADNSTGAPFNSAAADEFAARATGGVRFVTAVDSAGNPTAGVTVASGGGSWSSLSDRNAKANFAAVDGRDVLARVLRLPIQTWNYRSQDAAIRHLGPMAQDFHAAFGLGEDDTHIDTVDAEGVSLAAIQGLAQVVQDQDAEIAALRAEQANEQRQTVALQAQVTELRQENDALKAEEARQAQQNAALAARVATIERTVGTGTGGAPPWNAGLPLTSWPLVGLVMAGLAVVSRRRSGG